MVNLLRLISWRWKYLEHHHPSLPRFQRWWFRRLEPAAIPSLPRLRLRRSLYGETLFPAGTFASARRQTLKSTIAYILPFSFPVNPLSLPDLAPSISFPFPPTSFEFPLGRRRAILRTVLLTGASCKKIGRGRLSR